jgi:hypothetical protein
VLCKIISTELAKRERGAREKKKKKPRRNVIDLCQEAIYKKNETQEYLKQGIIKKNLNPISAPPCS